jgi:hypothetical protein
VEQEVRLAKKAFVVGFAVTKVALTRKAEARLKVHLDYLETVNERGLKLGVYQFSWLPSKSTSKVQYIHCPYSKNILVDVTSDGSEAYCCLKDRELVMLEIHHTILQPIIILY